MKLRFVKCPSCGQTIRGAGGKGRAPTGDCYEHCLRRCEVCGIGFSNTDSYPTIIYQEPTENVPEQAREFARCTLLLALNVNNRHNKLAKFGFSTSEDAITWTVFSYLQEYRKLRRTFNRIPVTESIAESEEPVMLLWGVPVPLDNIQGWELRRLLISVSDQLGEKERLRTEPDIVLDFGRRGLVFIESKYILAGKKKEERHRKSDTVWDKYVKDKRYFRDPFIVKSSRYYQLARNWRIGSQLAGSRPFVLLGLHPIDLALLSNTALRRRNERLDSFSQGLRTRKTRRFEMLQWKDLIDSIPLPCPRWFEEFVASRLYTKIRRLQYRTSR